MAWAGAVVESGEQKQGQSQQQWQLGSTVGL